MHASRRLVAPVLALLTFAGFLAVTPAPASAAPEPACDAAVLQDVVSANTTVSSAELVTTPEPHCRVDGFVLTDNPVTGEPAANTVSWMVALPEDHNGRYFFIGLGGTAGFVPDPPADLLAEGWAVAGTDTGSEPGLDWGFMFDPTRALDHSFRGGHVSAVATQAITKAYYGIDTLYRYHSGCSGGGRMGRSAATVYPDDYDGIVLGAPGRSVGNVVHFGQVAQYLHFNPDAYVPPAELQAIRAEVLADWDAADGAVDGMIWDPGVIEYSESELDEVLGGLTPAQRTAVDMILAGFDIGANVEMNGYPISGAHLWSAWFEDLPGFPYPFVQRVFDTFAKGSFGPDFDFITEFDFDSVEQVNQFAENFEPTLFASTFTGSDLLDFRDSGGKIVYWHGSHDNVISGFDLPQTYEEVVAASGGEEAAAEWFRAFWVPGISHCGGGLGPADIPDRALDALVEWVEGGDAPEVLIGTRPSDGRTFRVCTYPGQSIFLGGVDNPYGLDVDDASHWVCEGDSHGQVVSAAAQACPPGPDHGACVREWARKAPHPSG